MTRLAAPGSSASRQAAAAGARRLLLTHLMPGTDPAAAQAAARRGYHGEVGVATAVIKALVSCGAKAGQ